MAAKPKRRPALVARIVVTGISTAGTFGIVGALASAASTSNAASSADPAVTDPLAPDSATVPATTRAAPVVVLEIHHTVYVDQYGNPVDPSSFTGPTSLATVANGGAGSAATRVAAASTATPGSVGAGSVVTQAVNRRPGGTVAPSGTSLGPPSSPPATAPPSASPTAPATEPATAPPTAPPAPPSTAPRPTSPPAPKPTAPPCKGSKCH